MGNVLFGERQCSLLQNSKPKISVALRSRKPIFRMKTVFEFESALIVTWTEIVHKFEINFQVPETGAQYFQWEISIHTRVRRSNFHKAKLKYFDTKKFPKISPACFRKRPSCWSALILTNKMVYFGVWPKPVWPKPVWPNVVVFSSALLRNVLQLDIVKVPTFLEAINLTAQELQKELSILGFFSQELGEKFPENAGVEVLLTVCLTVG